MKVFKYKRKFNGTTSNNIIQGRIGGESSQNQHIIKCQYTKFIKTKLWSKTKTIYKIYQHQNMLSKSYGNFSATGAELGCSPIPIRKY